MLKRTDVTLPNSKALKSPAALVRHCYKESCVSMRVYGSAQMEGGGSWHLVFFTETTVQTMFHSFFFFSVLGGVDIAELVRGAQDMERATSESVAFDENPAAIYAAVRNELYKSGKKIEILASYEPKLQYIAEWWKQLYGESEGKDGLGIFPASVTLTADLHSMGQYIQEGERTLFESVISVEKPRQKFVIEADAENLDGLNFLAGKSLSEVNRMAERLNFFNWWLLRT